MATQPLDDEWETITPKAVTKAPVPQAADDEWETVPAVSSKGVETPSQRGFGTRFADEFKGASQQGFLGLVSRKAMDWSDYGMDDLKKKFPNQSDDWYEKTHEKAIVDTQRGMIAEADAKAKKILRGVQTKPGLRILLPVGGLLL